MKNLPLIAQIPCSERCSRGQGCATRRSLIYFERTSFSTSRMGLRSFGEKTFGTDKYFDLGTKRLAAFSSWSKFSPAMQSASANPLNRAANSISTRALRPSK